MFSSVKPSEATVHWTVALNCSNLHRPNKKHHLKVVLLLGGLEEIRSINVFLGQALGSNSPLDCCIELLESPQTKQKAPPKGGAFAWWT